MPFIFIMSSSTLMQTGQLLPGAGQDIIKEVVAHVNDASPFWNLNGLDQYHRNFLDKILRDQSELSQCNIS